MRTVRRTAVIVIAGMILAGMLMYTEHPSVRALKDIGSLLGIIDSEITLIGMEDVRSTDHRRGNEDSAVVLVEYSDFTCLMCAAMQDNLERIAREENILVVSRHLFPHGNSLSLERAVAAECVAKHTNEEAYFTFAGYLYTHQDAHGATREDLYAEAVALGADPDAYKKCVRSDRAVHKRVMKDSEEGWRLGARGTPYIVVMYNGTPIGISYANEYGRFLERVRTLVAVAKRRGSG